MKHRDAGFTLVEVLVAMMIMAIMAVMSWQGIDGIVRARTATQARLEQTLRLGTVMTQWDQDMATVQDSYLYKGIQCDGNAVRLTKRTPDGIQVIVWTFRPDDDSGGAWVRWSSVPAKTVGELNEAWQRGLQLQGGEARSIKTLTGVSALKVYFYFDANLAACTSTIKSDDLPSGARVVLSFGPTSGFSGDLVRDTLVRPQ